MANATPMERAANDDQLADFLSDLLNRRVTRRELEAPTSDLMTRVFMAVFREAGLDETAFEMSQGLVPLSVSNVVPTVHLTKLMQVVFSKLGVADVGTADILDPKPKRSRKLLRLLMKFWLQLSRTWTSYGNVEVHLAAAKSGRDARIAQLDAVRARINQLSQHPGNDLARMTAAENELATLNKALAAKNSKREQLVSDYQELKNLSCHLNERMKKGEQEVLDLKSEVHDVRAKTCSSPQRRLRCLVEEAERLRQLQEDCSSLRPQVEELQQKTQSIPRKQAVLAQLQSKLHPHLAVSERLGLLLREKEEGSSRRKIAEEEYHRLLKERERAAEEKQPDTPFELQAMERTLKLKKEQLAEAEQHLEELQLQQQERACSKDSEVVGLDAAIREVEDKVKKLQLASSEKVAETRRDIEWVFARHWANLEEAGKVYGLIKYRDEPPKSTEPDVGDVGNTP